MNRHVVILAVLSLSIFACRSTPHGQTALAHIVSGDEVLRSEERTEQGDIVRGRAFISPNDYEPWFSRDAVKLTGIDGLTVVALYPDIRAVLVEQPLMSAFDLIVELNRIKERFSYIEPEYVLKETVEPTKEEHWSYLWGLRKIRAPKAWDCTTGSDQVLVAVADGGIENKSQSDLDDLIWESSIPFDVTIDVKTVNCPKKSNGYDVLTGECKTKSSTHGTHVAGTIAAERDDKGVVGVNWRARLMSVRFMVNGAGRLGDAIKALEFIRKAKSKYPDEIPVKVVNLSWGTTGNSKPLLEELKLVAAEDILIVAAAGNDGTDNDVKEFYPSNYVTEIDEMISVAASDQSDKLLPKSNRGATTVYLAAPGWEIASTDLVNHASLSGTSMAAAHVSGAAALVASVCKEANAFALREFILATVDPIDEPKLKTKGRLNVAEAIRSCGCQR